MADLSFSIQEVVVASNDVEAAAKRFGDALGGPVDDKVSYPQAGIEIDMTGVWVGDFHIAFVQDSSGSGPVSRFLEKRGEGRYEAHEGCGHPVHERGAARPQGLRVARRGLLRGPDRLRAPGELLGCPDR